MRLFPPPPCLDDQAERILDQYEAAVEAGRIVFERKGAQAVSEHADWATVGGCITPDRALGLTAWVSPDSSFPAEAFEMAARLLLRKGPLIDARA